MDEEKHKTLCRFEKRITSLIHKTITPLDIQELQNSYLSTYECYSTITEDIPNSDRKCNSGIILMRILRNVYGINIKGVTSERKIAGKFLTSVRQDPKNKIIYIGKHSYFTGNKSHKWRLLPEDKKL